MKKWMKRPKKQQQGVELKEPASERTAKCVAKEQIGNETGIWKEVERAGRQILEKVAKQ